MIAETEGATLKHIVQASGRPRDWNCSYCRRLIGRVTIATGSFVEIKCPRCNLMNSIIGPTNLDKTLT